MATLEVLLRNIEELGDYDLHDILRRPCKVGWCEWHLNIDENDKAVRIAEKFHRQFKKLKPTSSIIREIDTIERTCLKFLPIDHGVWDRIRNYFKQARAENNPIPIIKAYDSDQRLARRLNMHSAVNTYHARKLYCTPSNCPILAQTQEYTEAFTRILFHPKLDQFLVRRTQVYRGIVVKNKKLVDNYKEGTTIITTTFLFASKDRAVAEMFGDVSHGDMNTISVFVKYNINNVNRHTALDLEGISAYPEDGGVLILRYVPFIIQSVQRKEDGRRIEICLDELPE